MDRRGQPNRRNNQEEDDNSGWALFGIAAAAVAAGAYLFSQRNESSTSARQVVAESSSSEESEPSNDVILAVDATPTKGGGILRMSNNGGRKILYFYSVNWSNYLEFPHQSDKFEMVNALLALLALKTQILNLKRESWDNLLLKVDNNFVNTSRYPDAEDNGVLQQFKKELGAQNGTAKQISQGDDDDMKNANQLSKGGAGEWIRSRLQENYAGYRLIDVSDSVMEYLSSEYTSIVPSKYHA